MKSVTILDENDIRQIIAYYKNINMADVTLYIVKNQEKEETLSIEASIEVRENRINHSRE